MRLFLERVFILSRESSDERSWCIFVLQSLEDRFRVRVEDKFRGFVVSNDDHGQVNGYDYRLMIHLGDALAVLKDSSTTNFHSLFGPIYVDMVVIWEIVWDVEEFLLESAGVF